MVWAGADAAEMAIRLTAATADRRYGRLIFSSRAANYIHDVDFTRAVYMRPMLRVLSFAKLPHHFPGRAHHGAYQSPLPREHVGSLIRPATLIQAREKADKGEMSDDELKRIQHAAIREAVHLQEELGLKLVTDGEYNRRSWHRDFMLKFRNVRMMPSKLSVRFHSANGARLHSPPTMQVIGRLARPDGGIFVEHLGIRLSSVSATLNVT